MRDFDRLCEWHGIAPDFFNYRNEYVQVAEENRSLLLTALGVNANKPGEYRDDVDGLFAKQWRSWLGPLCIARPSSGLSFTINIDRRMIGDDFTWIISADDVVLDQAVFVPNDTAELQTYQSGDAVISRRQVALPFLKPGYYDLLISSGDQHCESTLAVVPEHAYAPPWVDNGERLWGVIIQLYTLRSARDWGIGDFSDLRELIIYLAQAGADVVGLNPLHALLPNVQYCFSPYSPSDRRFISPLYISVEEMTEYNVLPQQYRDDAKATITSLRQEDSIDYEQIKNLKYSFFEKAFSLFLAEHVGHNTARGKAFSVFRDKQGDSLTLFALYEVARNRWINVDSAYIADIDDAQLLEAKADRDVLAALVDTHSRGVLFHCYLQWICRNQLRLCQDEASNRGMKVGLLRDLAVGADGEGAEVTVNADLYCRGAAVGAPPDPLAERGQNWGLPPVKLPDLRRTGFAHFIELLRTNMSECGALRIDHAMSLMRLWWCPSGKTADHGAYIYYPFAELLGILVLESHLNECVIVAEDLGVVPPEFRQALVDAKIFTNKMFYFERYDDGSFKMPLHYDVHSLAMVNNHDVPTLVSWWNKTDLVLRYNLGLLEEGADLNQVLANREHDKYQLVERLKAEGILPGTWRERDLHDSADEALITSILVLVARASSQLYVLQLEDVLLMDAPVNLPGTSTQYPNWQRKLSMPLESIFARPQIAETFAKLDKERKP